jgi:hypothetical protein
MNFFLKVHKTRTVPSIQMPMVFKFFGCVSNILLKRKLIFRFCLILRKNVLILRISPKAASKFCPDFPSLPLVYFLLCLVLCCLPFLDAGKNPSKCTQHILKALPGRLNILSEEGFRKDCHHLLLFCMFSEK